MDLPKGTPSKNLGGSDAHGEERKSTEQDDNVANNSSHSEGAANERRYQKQDHDTGSSDDTDREEKRYHTRLRPSDHKPSSYHWGYKDWSPPGDEGSERRADEGDDTRDLDLRRGQEAPSTSTGKSPEEEPGENPESDAK